MKLRQKSVKVQVLEYQSNRAISTDWATPHEAGVAILGANPDSVIFVRHRPSGQTVDTGRGGQVLAVGENCTVEINVYNGNHWKS